MPRPSEISFSSNLAVSTQAGSTVWVLGTTLPWPDLQIGTLDPGIRTPVMCDYMHFFIIKNIFSKNYKIVRLFFLSKGPHHWRYAYNKELYKLGPLRTILIIYPKRLQKCFSF